MNTRLVTALIATLAFAVGLTACDTETADSAALTTANPSTADQSTPFVADTPTTEVPATAAITAAQFDDNVVAARKLLDDATGDFCDVVQGTQGIARIGRAATPEQAHAVYSLFRDSLVKMSDNVPKKFSHDANVIERAANEAYDEAEAGGFDPQRFNLQSAPPSMMTEEFLDAMSNINAAIETTCDTASK